MVSRQISACCAVALCLAGTAAVANTYRGPAAPCGAGGWVRETAAPNTQGSWRIRVTGAGGPADVIHEFVATGTTDQWGHAWFRVAGSYGGRQACDATNIAIVTPAPAPGGGPGGGVRRPNAPMPRPGEVNPWPVPNPNPPLPPGVGVGAQSWLDIESLWVDPDTGLFGYEGIWWRLRRSAGMISAVNIPDLFADTNGDGVIGVGDLLYSFVDLFAFLEAPPTFSLGDRYSIVDGQVAGLPGMWFSATPIYLDPLLGPRPTGGQWFSTNMVPFAGGNGSDAVALSAHTLETPIPEPSAWALMIAGFGAIGLALRRRGGAAVAA